MDVHSCQLNSVNIGILFCGDLVITGYNGADIGMNKFSSIKGNGIAYEMRNHHFMD